jgi:hypothetical protein
MRSGASPGWRPQPGTHNLDRERPRDHSNWMRWYFKPALKRAGLVGVRFLDLLHTYRGDARCRGRGLQGVAVDGARQHQHHP